MKKLVLILAAAAAFGATALAPAGAMPPPPFGLPHRVCVAEAYIAFGPHPHVVCVKWRLAW